MSLFNNTFSKQTFVGADVADSRRKMHGGNQSGVSEFFSLGISENPEQQPGPVLDVLAYVPGHSGGKWYIILAIGSDSRLHTPMCFFLASLSIATPSSSPTQSPQMLVNLQVSRTKPSHTEVVTQLYFLISMVTLDNLILAYDGILDCVAICTSPLLHHGHEPLALHFYSSPWVGHSPVLCGLIHTLLMTSSVGPGRSLHLL